MVKKTKKSKRTNYDRGRAYEYKIRDWFLENTKCFYVIRSAGSKGPFDLIGISPDEIYLIQCKKPPVSNSIIRQVTDAFLEFDSRLGKNSQADKIIKYYLNNEPITKEMLLDRHEEITDVSPDYWQGEG